MVAHVLDVPEVETTADLCIEDFCRVAEMVLSMAPNPGDQETRAALIHMTLRRLAGCSISPNPDALAQVMKQAGRLKLSHERPLGSAFARVLSLTFSAYAGDLPDPADGAHCVVLHRSTSPHPNNFHPVALLGNFLFLKDEATLKTPL